MTHTQYDAPMTPADDSGAVPAVALPMLRMLCVSLDAGSARDVTRWMGAAGERVEQCPDLAHAARRLRADAWDVVLLLLDEEPEHELAAWGAILRAPTAHPTPRLIVAVRHPSVSLAVRAVQLGALDVLSLPLRREELYRTLERVRSAADDPPLPLPAIATPADVSPTGRGIHDLVGESPAMFAVYKLIAQTAPSATTVLILGESGTGKEMIARAIHRLSPRSRQPFIAVNCAAIPENLLESELFGHEKGAFTGAVTRKNGRFERASGGTLFLDEIGDMSLALQSKILRAIQEREIERVGGTEPFPVDVRLIAATNNDLVQAIAERRFREDLYYRLAVVTIRLPRLADRGDDLLLLATHFISTFGIQNQKDLRYISTRALRALRQHAWPGNVRELRNAIERAVLLVEGDTLRPEHLPEEWRDAGNRPTVPITADRNGGTLATLREVEARHVAAVLEHTGGQITRAAEILGLHRNTLTRKIREYGL